MTKKELILSLIKDDLTNLRLVAGLEVIGLDSGKYYLNLCDTIFDLLSIDKGRDKIIETYLKLAERVQAPESFEPEKLEELAQTIYTMLIYSAKKSRKVK